MDAALAIMQQQLNEVGFNIEILQVDVPELIRRYVDETDFDIFYNAGGVFRADPSISGTYFDTANFTPGGGNGSHYSNPRVDELFAQGKAQTDQAERKATYTELAQDPQRRGALDLPLVAELDLRRSATGCRASRRRATSTTSSGTPRSGRSPSRRREWRVLADARTARA